MGRVVPGRRIVPGWMPPDVQGGLDPKISGKRGTQMTTPTSIGVTPYTVASVFQQPVASSVSTDYSSPIQTVAAVGSGGSARLIEEMGTRSLDRAIVDPFPALGLVSTKKVGAVQGKWSKGSRACRL
ncbi:hypothetical protein BD311DRAFT_769331 [Dichomitus squalens]|uniref:Uncharacterized protein n=1 Tax=Dichomitus squalens TaxID=114155 RepID=A0A4V2JZ02_9APHY|nr:hypothetical protein BD311DRAFT_769331 [Dichomitus squalens]